MTPRTLWRIQASDGRGPYRPGVSDLWAGADHARRAGWPWMAEFPALADNIQVCMPPGTYAGCAFPSADALCRWFSLAEQARLHELGFVVVRFTPDGILAESLRQVVFYMRAPLATLNAYAIPHGL